MQRLTGVQRLVEKAALRFLDADQRAIYMEWKKTLQMTYQPEKLRQLTKYIGKLSDEGTILDFNDEFNVFSSVYPEYELDKYAEILAANGIAWTEASMRKADVSSLSERAALALLMGLFRANFFSDGVLDQWCRDGVVDAWLERLKALDAAREREPEMADVVALKMILRYGDREETLEITTSELFISEQLDASSSVTHHYTFGKGLMSEISEQILEEVRTALLVDGWGGPGVKPNGASYAYTLAALCADGTTIERSGDYDRVNMPEEAWKNVIAVIRPFWGCLGSGISSPWAVL